MTTALTRHRSILAVQSFLGDRRWWTRVRLRVLRWIG